MSALNPMLPNSIYNHEESNAPAACDDIGIGIRRAFAILQNLTSNDSKDWPQAFWCLWALDRMYCSDLSMTTTLSSQTVYPLYPATTNTPAYIQSDARLLLSFNSEDTISIEAFYLQLLDVWAQAMEFVRGMEDGECGKAWASNGLYQQVVSSVYEVEIRAGEIYRLRNAKPANCSLTQLHFQRCFWAPWFMMQILYHAIQALINHPLLHIVRTCGDRERTPPSFLQHTVIKHYYTQAGSPNLSVFVTARTCTQRSIRRTSHVCRGYFIDVLLRLER
jgi:hypothetical protein